ncbi:MAG TPA: hypothetical protein VGS41_04855, partial [Chthonomonadales bacterium]|nr:hypothetical protein [Chthonomonadales bacterium]
PGVFVLKDGSASSVLQAMALTQGLAPFWTHEAYIYRTASGSGAKSEIPVDLKKIMQRKAPDVPLMANDILYIPEATGRKAALTTLGKVAEVSVGLSATLLYIYH